jgi:uncharacterized protein YcbX
MQGSPVDSVRVRPSGVEGDREWAVIDSDSGRLLSAKRYSALLQASAGGTGFTLPDGTAVAYDDPSVNGVLSAWIGQRVHLAHVEGSTRVDYEMTFEPPNDDAEYVTIPAPPGTFLDLAGIHLVSAQTLDACAKARPDLDWDVRRFRPNVVVDVEGLEPFGEDGWCGSSVQVGGAVLSARQPTVRCAMPLRAQPGLARQRDLYAAMEELHRNHLGIYMDVVAPGTIRVGDPVSVRS